MVEGALIGTTEFDIISIDPASCAQNWRTHVDYPGYLLPTNRGAAYLDGLLYRGTEDGRVLAYDFKTGKRVWEIAIADPKKNEVVPAAPIAWEGLVFIGNAGGDQKDALMNFDRTLLSRIQFAFAMSLHIIFPASRSGWRGGSPQWKGCGSPPTIPSTATGSISGSGSLPGPLACVSSPGSSCVVARRATIEVEFRCLLRRRATQGRQRNLGASGGADLSVSPLAA